MMASTCGSAKPLRTRPIVFGCRQISASMKKTIAPAALLAPRFRAWAGPRRPPVEITFAPNRCAISTVLSVEPSSTITHSSGWTSEALSDSRQSVRVRAALYAGIMTEIVAVIGRGAVKEHVCCHGLPFRRGFTSADYEANSPFGVCQISEILPYFSITWPTLAGPAVFREARTIGEPALAAYLQR